MGSPVLPLSGSSRTLNRETTSLCWRLPYTKTARNIRRTTGFSVGCQAVNHVHLPSSFNFQKNTVEYHSYADDTQVYLHCDNNVASLRHAVH